MLVFYIGYDVENFQPPAALKNLDTRIKQTLCNSHGYYGTVTTESTIYIIYVCITTNQPHTKSNPNPNPTTK